VLPCSTFPFGGRARIVFETKHRCKNGLASMHRDPSHPTDPTHKLRRTRDRRAGRCTVRSSSAPGRCPGTPRMLPGSMDPYAPVLFDDVCRAMPIDRPRSLTKTDRRR